MRALCEDTAPELSNLLCVLLWLKLLSTWSYLMKNQALNLDLAFLKEPQSSFHRLEELLVPKSSELKILYV